MTNFIPIFPLSIVVYPGELLNLHIFEPRYKQLVKECIEYKKPFGIPAVINDNISELGTMISVTELVKEYEDVLSFLIIRTSFLYHFLLSPI